MEVFSTLDGTNIDKRPVCMALGLFDGLHTGHMRVINAAVGKARSLGLKSCVFTFTMRHASPPGKKPLRILTFSLFKDILEQAGVDYIVRPDFAEFRDIAPSGFVRDILMDKLGVKYVFCGENFRFGKSASASAVDIEGFGGDIEAEIIPMLSMGGEPVSSSKIRSLIETGDIPAANEILGRRFSIDFRVVRGRKLGRTIGAPTINQPFPDSFISPRFGVYATLSKIGERWYSSVTNVGVKPTVGSDCVLAETYIHDFSGDLYGRRVRVEFISFMRPEMRFSSVDELKAQIAEDSRKSKDIIAN